MKIFIKLVKMETREEFIKKLNGSEEFESYLDELFKGIDKNNNGFIENSELYFCISELAKIGFKKTVPSKEEVEEIMNQREINKDGKLSKDEFRPLIKDICLQLFDKGSFN